MQQMRIEGPYSIVPLRRAWSMVGAVESFELAGTLWLGVQSTVRITCRLKPRCADEMPGCRGIRCFDMPYVEGAAADRRCNLNGLWRPNLLGQGNP